MKTPALLMTAAMDAPEDWLAVAKTGDLAAFEALMRQYERLVLVTALRLLGNLEDAQDVAQEVFLRLHRHLGRLQSSENPAGWLYKVTVNLCRDHRRRNPAWLSAEALAEIPASTADAQQELSEAERRRALRLSLRMLPEKERAALVLRDLEGLSTSEVAQALGSSEATVRSQISKARIKVRGFVERYFRRRA